MSDMHANFEENGTNRTSQKSHKKIIIVVAILAIVLITIIGVYLSQTVFLTDDQKDEKIAQIYATEGYDAALDMIVDYYGTSSDKAISWIIALSEADDKKLLKQIEIVDQNLSTRSSRNYFDYEVTVKNNSEKTLSYIEVNIYLKDASKNIIYSDWTNWSGSLPPGGSTVLDTMIPYQEGVKFYNVSVKKVS